jgi:predicted enzyme related to lactoylglutathione lyase
MVMSMNRENVCVWFEIPARDHDRQVAFYERVLAAKLEPWPMEGQRISVIAARGPNGSSGCVMTGPGSEPGPTGTTVYLNCDGALEATLGRVGEAGGQVIVPITSLPPGMGRFALFIDPEGNKVGLHSAD